MSCYKVMNEAGESDPRFDSLVEFFNGDEQKALHEYVRSFVLGKGKFKFSIVSDTIPDSKEFVESFFSVTDKFTEKDADQIKEHQYNHFAEKMVDGEKKLVFYNANGSTEVINPSDLSASISKLIEDKQKMDASLLEKLQELFLKNVPGKDFSTAINKAFPQLNPTVVFSMLSGMNKAKIFNYQDYAGKPWFVNSFKDEKIMIHESEVDGQKQYTVIMPTLDHGTKDRSGSGSTSFMSTVFGNSKSAQQKGFTIKNNIAGRKQLIGTLVAMAIKNAEPDAKIKAIRFASFANRGETYNLDLVEGINNVKALLSNQETDQLIPAELRDIASGDKSFDVSDYEISWMESLYRSEMAKKGIEGEYFDKSLTRNWEEKNIDHLIRDIERRIFYIVKTYDQPLANGTKPYEDPSHPIGQEMYSLAKAKEELIQSNGIDKRNYNKNATLSAWGSWRRSLGEIQNAQLNMVYNEFNSEALGYKQRFDDFLKEKEPVFKDYIREYERAKGISARSRVANYTEKFYDNLFEQKEVRVMENGKVTDKKVKVNIQKFKDPEDTSNGLLDFERKFIRDVVAFHKKSILRFIEKKIEKREINSELYKTAEEWYNAKYKTQELLLPVMRKQSGNSLLEGNIKESLKATLNEGNQFLEISPKDLIEDRIYKPEGSASMQIGGVFGHKSRVKSLGLEFINGEYVLIDPALNNRAMKDVEQVLHSSVFQNFKFEFEEKLTATYYAAKIILIKEALTTGVKRTNELKHLEALFNNMLYNERENIIQGNKNPEKALDATRRLTSTATLALNWKANALATSGNLFSLISNAITNRFGDQYFSGKDLTKAMLFSSKNPKKFGAIIDEFMFHDKNETAMVFSSKYKAAEKGFIKNHHLMLLNNLGDRYTRGLVLIAQLQHEGLIDNFEFNAEGKLVYNWSKDKRSEKVKTHIREKNAKQEKRDLPYDDIQVNTLHSITAKMFGAYSDEDRTRMRTNGLAQWAGQFKGYLVARSNELVQSGFDNTNIAWYSEENGQLKLNTFYQEGIANTMFHFFNEVGRMDMNAAKAYQNLRPEQKKNLQKLVFDALLFGSLMLIYGAVLAGFEDEEKTMTPAQRKAFQSNYNYLKYAFLDIVGVYNVNDYLDAVTPASIPVLKRYANALQDFVTLDFEGAFDKAVMKTGAGKSANDIIAAFE